MHVINAELNSAALADELYTKQTKKLQNIHGFLPFTEESSGQADPQQINCLMLKTFMGM